MIHLLLPTKGGWGVGGGGWHNTAFHFVFQKLCGTPTTWASWFKCRLFLLHVNREEFLFLLTVWHYILRDNW